MNFLQLVQRLHRQVGATGRQPIGTTEQVGEAARLVDYVAEADYDWQSKWFNWKFLHRSLPTNWQVSPQLDSLPPNDLFMWDRQTFFILVDGAWQPLRAYEYEEVKRRIPDVSDPGAPYEVIILPNNNLRFIPVPDQAYKLMADYHRKPIRLVNPTDVSPVPEEYHPTVVLGQAVLYYANFEDAPELVRDGQMLIDRGVRQLEASQLPLQSSEYTMGVKIAMDLEG